MSGMNIRYSYIFLECQIFFLFFISWTSSPFMFSSPLSFAFVIIGFISHRSLMMMMTYILTNVKTLFFDLIFRLREVHKTYYNPFQGPIRPNSGIKAEFAYADYRVIPIASPFYKPIGLIVVFKPGLPTRKRQLWKFSFIKFVR